MITGMCFVFSSRVMARVAWKPLRPGITTSIRMRSGCSLFERSIAASPLSTSRTSKPRFFSRPSMKARSVGESSTTMIFLIAMFVSRFRVNRAVSRGAALSEVRLHRAQQAFLGEGLGQVFVGSHHAAARAVEEAVLRRQHDHRRRAMLAALLDQRAGLLAVEPRHHDVHVNEITLVISDLSDRLETALGEDHLAAGLHEEDLRAAPDGV